MIISNTDNATSAKQQVSIPLKSGRDYFFKTTITIWFRKSQSLWNQGVIISQCTTTCWRQRVSIPLKSGRDYFTSNAMSRTKNCLNPFEIRAWLFRTWILWWNMGRLNPFEIRAWLFLNHKGESEHEERLNPFEIRAWLFPRFDRRYSAWIVSIPLKSGRDYFLCLTTTMSEWCLNPFEIRAWLFR